MGWFSDTPEEKAIKDYKQCVDKLKSITTKYTVESTNYKTNIGYDPLYFDIAWNAVQTNSSLYKHNTFLDDESYTQNNFIKKITRELYYNKYRDNFINIVQKYITDHRDLYWKCVFINHKSGALSNRITRLFDDLKKDINNLYNIYYNNNQKELYIVTFLQDNYKKLNTYKLENPDEIIIDLNNFRQNLDIVADAAKNKSDRNIDYFYNNNIYQCAQSCLITSKNIIIFTGRYNAINQIATEYNNNMSSKNGIKTRKDCLERGSSDGKLYKTIHDKIVAEAFDALNQIKPVDPSQKSTASGGDENNITGIFSIIILVVIVLVIILLIYMVLVETGIIEYKNTNLKIIYKFDN